MLWQGLKIPRRAHLDTNGNSYCSYPMSTMPKFTFDVPDNAKDLIQSYQRYQWEAQGKVLTDTLSEPKQEWFEPSNDTLFRLCVEVHMHDNYADYEDEIFDVPDPNPDLLQHGKANEKDQRLALGVRDYQIFYSLGLGCHRWPAIVERLVVRELISMDSSEAVQIPGCHDAIPMRHIRESQLPLFGNLWAASNLLILDGDHFDLLWGQHEVTKFLDIIRPTNSRLGIVVSLLARPKYDPFILEQQILQRVFVPATDSAKSGLRKIKCLNVPRDCYCVGDTLVDPGALCLYACAIPKDPMMLDESDGNPRTCPWAHIDVNTKGVTNLSRLRAMLEITGVWVRIVAMVETRSGYHILYTSDASFDKELVTPFNEFKFKYSRVRGTNKLGQPCTDYWFLPNHDNMVQLPGSWQAGTWRVQMVNANTWPSAMTLN